MIDGSSFTFDENVRMTRAVVAAAREKGVSVEAEIGHVVSGKVIVERSKGESMLTDPEEAGRFAQQAAIEPVLSRYFEISGSIGRGGA